MKELYKIELKDKFIGIEIPDEFDLIINTEGLPIKIKTYHSQDCCENVYADFSSMKYAIADINKEKDYIKTILFTGVEGMGFLIHFDDKKYFIPCYNYQNGYYSSDLELEIKVGEVSTKIDISNLVEAHID